MERNDYPLPLPQAPSVSEKPTSSGGSSELPNTPSRKGAKEGDLVYDPFMGTGTTAVACHMEKRNWVGSEISNGTASGQKSVYGKKRDN